MSKCADENCDLPSYVSKSGRTRNKYCREHKTPYKKRREKLLRPKDYKWWKNGGQDGL